MTLNSDSLVSSRVDVAGDLDDAIEMCYERGWTDGLPVVPPTEEKVLRFLEFVERDPSDVIGIEPVRGRVVTAEKVAINAVMAGCKPEYMPIIMATVEGMVLPEYNLHGSSASTGGSAPLLIINGPIRQKLGFASGNNLFGPGPDRRPNATVGRAIRMILINVLENHPGVLDRSTLGHPGKYSFCIAEDEENSPWEPLHVEKGFDPDASTVTVAASHGPQQMGVVWEGTPEAMLINIADTMLGIMPRQGEVILVMSIEHSHLYKNAGWTKQQVKQFVYDHACRTHEEYAQVKKVDPPEPGQEKDLIHAIESPDALTLISGGGAGGPWDCIITRWGRGVTSKSITKQIDTSKIL